MGLDACVEQLLEEVAESWLYLDGYWCVGELGDVEKSEFGQMGWMSVEHWVV